MSDDPAELPSPSPDDGTETKPESPTVGRPTLYTDELAITILTRLVEGASLNKICFDESMPSVSTVLRWRRKDEEFRKHYAQAQIDRADTHHEEIFDIADDGRNDWMARNDPDNPGYVFNGEHVQRSKLRVETRKWSAARMNPKAYGDRIHQEVSGPDGGPVQYEDTRERNLAAIEAVSARIAGPVAGETAEG